MSYSITEPSNRQKWVAGVLVIVYAVITLIPLVWIIATGFKTPSDAIAYPPKVIFSPSLEGYVNLFTSRTRLDAEGLAAVAELPRCSRGRRRYHFRRGRHPGLCSRRSILP